MLNVSHEPSENIGEIAQNDNERPAEPRVFKTTPGKEKIPVPSICPRLSITAESNVTS